MISVHFEPNFCIHKRRPCRQNLCSYAPTLTHPGASTGCFRGDHSPSNVDNTGFAFELWEILCSPPFHEGKHPELSASGGVHKGHRRLVRCLRLLRLQRPPWVCSCQLRFQVERKLFFVMFGHTWYLSPPSPTCRWRKNLSCGEISEFYKEFEQFMEFLSKFMPFFVLICVEKKWAQKCVCGEKNDKYEVWDYMRWCLHQMWLYKLVIWLVNNIVHIWGVRLKVNATKLSWGVEKIPPGDWISGMMMKGTSGVSENKALGSASGSLQSRWLSLD